MNADEETDEKELAPLYVGGVYEKTSNGVKYYGILTAAKRTPTGVLSGKIEYHGYPYETVDQKDLLNWNHVRGGVLLE